MGVPIVVQCACGKKLKAPDSAGGKRVRCPACGKGVPVPAAEPWVHEELAAQPPRVELCPSCQRPMPPGAVVCTQCGFNIQTGKQLSVQKRTAAAGPRAGRGLEGAGSALSGIFAGLPIGAAVKITVVLVIVALVGWWGYGFMHPAAVVEWSAQPVESYAVAADLTSTTAFRHLDLVSRTFGDFSLDGRDMLIITRPSPQESFIHVKTKLSRRYLSNQGKLKNDKFLIDPNDLQLLGADGKAVTGVFLVQQPTSKAQINLNRLPEKAQLPFSGPNLEAWRTPGQAQGDLKAQFRIDGVLEAVAGAWHYQAPGGLTVDLSGKGTQLLVNWDSQSTAWKASTSAEDSATAFDTFGDWPVEMLFPRPGQGPYKLKILDSLAPAPHP